MKDLITIKNVRGYLDENGTAQLNLEDVSRGLGFTETKDGKEYIRWRTVNGYLKEFNFSQEVAKEGLIPENIFYKLCFKASNETARKFQDIVTDEVLPSIRKHGAYITPETLDKILSDPDTIIEMAMKLKEERAKSKQLQLENKQHQQLIGELKPKATYYDVILKNKGLVTVTQIAKDYGMSAKAMNKILWDLGIQYKQSGQWLLYAKYHDKGYTHSETIVIQHSDGTDGVRMNTKWTQAGRLFLYDLLKSDGVYPVIEMDMTA